MGSGRRSALRDIEKQSEQTAKANEKTMCGRFTLTLPPDVFRRFYGYVEAPNFPPRHNIAPTQPVAVVLEEEGARHFKLMRWGFLPSWVKDPKDFPLVINARRETLTEKATFRNAIRRRRCVFLADHFYEWRREGKMKLPFAIRMKEGGPMPLAGLWETYTDASGGEIDTAAILTTDANGVLSAIHHRMPVILGGDEIAPWLAPETPLDDVLALTRPCPEEWLAMYPVSQRVNKVANDDGGLLEEVAGGEGVAEVARAVAKGERGDGQGELF
jgi:putative SOS response-associated peptidase YedK